MLLLTSVWVNILLLLV